ncbi:protein of unknown function [Magnetospirillum gryphiswaldense MSR-1 v2]|uniref:Metal-binding protein n=1 Tax=Magnetospirillum gryphiswaldense (strain DSM 6361 / JCM 21280 / NBRC 15271 / MSR-1) TaxID=431944 RepID=V6EWA2_MAGGM|nr:hypothetical protein [Magnetospirillum gryphiswaldense]CDK97469.1 protein of unknown function [Magnetospirillum gryphiswaldense MSR-1 v2]
MSRADQGCDLCGLPLPVRAYRIETPERPMQFCCDGCKGIWLMLHPDIEKGESHEPSHDGSV